MSDTVASSAELPEVAYPPAVSLHDAWPWTIFAASRCSPPCTSSASTRAPRRSSRASAVHEWVHDGRHLLGFPCH